jgi:phosphoserine phosphatase
VQKAGRVAPLRLRRVHFLYRALKQRLGLDYTISNRLEIENGRLTGKVLGEIVDADAKAAKFRAVTRELGAKKDETVAIGDGARRTASSAAPASTRC